MVWRLSRRLLTEGVDEEFDRTLRINRGFLDQLAVEMIDEMPDEIRGLLKETKAESEQGADGDNETSDDDDDRFSDDADEDFEEGYEGDDEDDASHDEEEHKVETMEISAGCLLNDTPPQTPEAGATGST